MPASLSFIFVAAGLLRCLVLAAFLGGLEVAYAGEPDRLGNNADIYSIKITPETVPAGTYPAITGFVHNTSSLNNRTGGNAVFDVTATITLPNGSQKSLLWQNVGFSANQRKSYAYVNNFDSSQAGTYKVVYFVYNSGRKHLYSSLSNSFTVYSPAVTPKPVQPSEKTQEPPTYERKAKAEISGGRKYVGIGGQVNTLNFSAGPSLILWPLQNFAIQGTYGFGTFGSYEARAFYRFALSHGLNPYFGAGYLHAERSASVLGTDTKIKGDGFTLFGGVELPLYKNLYGYVDVSGTSLKLKRDVVIGTTEATVTVKYTPVTICTGLVFYLF
jgi:outer membrane protein with beta-barrel domain